MIRQIPIRFKSSIAALSILLVFILDPAAAYAAPVTMADGTVFDAAYYAAAYPDVTVVLGTDPNVLYNHYLTAGRAEGRSPVAPGTSASASIHTLTESGSMSAATTSASGAASAATSTTTISPRDQQVDAALAAMQAAYPEGTPWTNANKYSTRMRLNGRTLTYNGYGCFAFALTFCDIAFGQNGSYTKVPACPASQIRIGDLVRVNTIYGGHTYVILSLDATGATIAEGNYNASVHYGRHVTTEELATNEFVITR